MHPDPTGSLRRAEPTTELDLEMTGNTTVVDLERETGPC
jgi:hypothetical protein